MTDKKMIEALRNYAKEYTSGKPYGFNPGLALMIANRMEQLIDIANDNNYKSKLSKESLLYNVEYHLLNDCDSIDECISYVKTLIDNFEEKNDRKN